MQHDPRSLFRLLSPLSLHISKPQAFRKLQTPVWERENDLSASACDSLTYWWSRFTCIFILNL